MKTNSKTAIMSQERESAPSESNEEYDKHIKPAGGTDFQQMPDNLSEQPSDDLSAQQPHMTKSEIDSMMDSQTLTKKERLEMATENTGMIICTEDDYNEVGANYVPRNMEESLRYIFNRMSRSVDKDLDQIKIGQPAVHKVLYCKRLVQQLKNKTIQKLFLCNDGLTYLSMWLEKSVDGCYPCDEVLGTILDICEFLPVGSEHLHGTKIGKQVKKLEKEALSEKIRSKASEVLHKWYRVVFELNTGYDESGLYERQYREYRKKRLVESGFMKGDNEEDEDELEEVPGPGGEGEKSEKTQKKELQYDQNGVACDRAYVPKKPSFDFTYRPVAEMEIPYRAPQDDRGLKNEITRSIHLMHKAAAKAGRRFKELHK
ncbi:unnamed protein product [Moneuplotes crassus]|uniref:TFIIS N-terminal domain-containing protein n=1 Tax=Euplotes crassus TaxID=5936 RepID=A0AAD1UR18_EUPCR|nr:unnamed protein product [Moneuplotes crassus]